jgi:hypothetical protein
MKKSNNYLKSNGDTGYTLSKFMDSLNVWERGYMLCCSMSMEQFKIIRLRVGLIMILNIYLLVLMYSVRKQDQSTTGTT